ncbi:MAG: uracil-DNA glycosylase [Bacteroidales bacterium]|jgi:uracil-DNA glycosylase|nr:uracil-DNA glycosylase [Bacteroidales bacterium]MDD2204303.1 uracil-DNA glycosylase [Bacteroidales bacterium]MDD3151355.1 uracil-DNA glycosylase [Bacteroidales bacterium]MDD3913184.1 uracil-DNA glycosylase [Bacteroidales bacterium]MDD4633099.1 uracil-DNA glycosylase [Bacteroidales bacterium]
MIAVNPKIEASWLDVLKEEFQSPYFLELKQFLIQEKSKYRIFPPGGKIFAAYDQTPFYEVKAVIIGQDPYHGYGQANGLCFSVNQGVEMPPSLINIFKELHDDIGCNVPQSGDLSKWAQQGVLMLNAVMTVRENCAGSHRNKGWEKITDASIKALSDKREHLVFILWGNYAKEKISLIDSAKHCILTAVHPSPLSANRGGFFGCKHFSKTNKYLTDNNITPINWELN